MKRKGREIPHWPCVAQSAGVPGALSAPGVLGAEPGFSPVQLRQRECLLPMPLFPHSLLQTPSFSC
jgi:hypothetical protein